MKKKKIVLLLACLLSVGAVGTSLTACSNDKSAVVLKDEKAAAVAEVEAYVPDLSVYSDANKEAIQSALTVAKNSIEEAKTQEEIDQAVATYKTAVDQIPTLVQEELAAYKSNAKGTIQGVDLSVYSDENKALVQAAQTTALAAIDVATDKAGVDLAVTTFLGTLSNIKTLAQELEEYKTTAKTALASYVDLDNYLDEEKAEINTIITAANAAIDVATDKVGVDTVVNEAKRQIDAVKTAIDHAIEEAKDELDSYISDLSYYSEANQNLIQTIVADAKSSLEQADEIDLVDEIVANAKADLDGILTIAEEKHSVAVQFRESLSNKENTSVENATIKFDTKGANISFYSVIGSQHDETVLFDAYLTPHYNSTLWDSMTIIFRGYDGSNNLRLAIYDGNMKIVKREWSATAPNNFVETVLSEIPFGIQDNTEARIRILCRGWTKTVIIDDTCIYRQDVSTDCVGYIGFESWETGFELREPKYIALAGNDDAGLEASGYNNDDNLWANTAYKTVAEKLVDDKASAIETLTNLDIDLSLYSEAKQTVISNIIKQAKDDVNDATSSTMVLDIVNKAQSDIALVPTIAEEGALTDALESAKNELNSYRNADNYSTYGKSALASALADGIVNIEACDSVAAVDIALKNAKNAIDQIKTKLEEEADIATFKTNSGWTEEEGVGYFSVDDGMIKMSANVDNTGSRVKFGNRDKSDYYFSAYISVAQQNSEWASFSLCFGCYDFNSGYELTFKQNSGKAYMLSWDANQGKRAETEIEGVTIPGLPNTSEHFIEVIGHGWQKAVYIDGSKIIQRSEDRSTCGQLFISTWNEHYYKIRAPHYETWDCDADMNDTPLNNRWW